MKQRFSVFSVVSGLVIGHISGDGVVSVGLEEGCLGHLCCFWEREESNTKTERSGIL